MSTFTHWRSPSSRLELAGLERRPEKYDIRVVDQFYVYCQAVARTDRYRDEARAQSHNALKRSIWTMLLASSFLFYYLMDRAAQAMSLF